MKAKLSPVEIPVEIPEETPKDSQDNILHHEVTFKVIIDVVYDELKLIDPVFRYKLFRNKTITKPIGTIGEWTKCAAKTEEDNEANEGTMLYSYTQEFPKVVIDKEFAKDFNNDPILVVFLADQGKLKSAQVSSQGSPETTHIGRNYISFFELDTSSLLAGEIKITQTWEDVENATNTACGLAPEGIRKLALTIETDKQLLPRKLKEILNPLTIHIKSLKNLPGINVTSNKHLEYLQPTTYTLLNKYCVPAYVSYNFYGIADLSSRVTRSVGMRQREKLNYGLKSTFLCHFIKQEELIEKLTSQSLCIEIHDRDILDQGRIEELINKWEALIIGKQYNTSEEKRNLDSGSEKPISPMTIFDVDEVAKRDIVKNYLTSGDRNPHGVALYSLSQLLDTSQTVSHSLQTKAPYTKCKIRSSVIQAEKRVLSEVIEHATDLHEMEKLVRQPGDYIQMYTSLSLLVELSRPLTKIEQDRQTLFLHLSSSTPFSRIVFFFKYEESSFLRLILKVIESINSAALPHAALRSYQLTLTEKTEANNGSLDIITGLQVIDKHYRMIIFEGLAEKGMQSIYDSIKRLGNNNLDFKFLANPEIRFSKRLYTEFNVDLKKIKLRHPLNDIMIYPEIYNRSKVSSDCFKALNNITNIRKANRLQELRDLDLFPSLHVLVELDSKYGESISMEDIHGFETSSLPAQEIDHISNTTQEGKPHANCNVDLDRSIYHGSHVKRKEDTDSSNQEYMKHKKNWKSTDYLLKNRKIVENIRESYKKKKAEITTEKEEVYMYSTQAMNSTEIKKKEMREILCKDRNAQYTYSKEFQSLSLCMVDEEKLQRDLIDQGKQKWTTKSGFVYPAPRNAEDFSTHPKQVSLARRDDLKQPWIEKLPIETNKSSSAGKPKFDSIPSKNMVFGGTNIDGSPNLEYYKSVHLLNDRLVAEIEAAKIKEQEEWKKKVVVDTIQFYSHGNTCTIGKKKPSQLDRVKDILEGEAKSKPIRIVRNALLPSGKKIPLNPPPFSIMADGAYYEHRNIQTCTRVEEPSKFHVKDLDGNPKDFCLRIHRDAYTSKMQRLRYKREIKPLQKEDKIGEKWRQA